MHAYQDWTCVRIQDRRSHAASVRTGQAVARGKRPHAANPSCRPDQGNRIWPECGWQPSDPLCWGPAGRASAAARPDGSHKAEGRRVKSHQAGFLLPRNVAGRGDSVKGFVSLASASFSFVRTIRPGGGTGPAADARPSGSIGKCDCLGRKRSAHRHARCSALHAARFFRASPSPHATASGMLPTVPAAASFRRLYGGPTLCCRSSSTCCTWSFSSIYGP